MADLRWTPPREPLPNRSLVQKGDVGRICTQAFPQWYLATLASQEGQPVPTQPPSPDPRETEDCLFLNVYVPEVIFSQRGNDSCKGAPVMVWIYGGGFTFTDNNYNPAGLIARSKENSDGVIYVSINYRVSDTMPDCGEP